MAIVKMPDEGKTLDTQEYVTEYLAGIGIDYESWDLPHSIAPDASAEEILEAYKPEINALKTKCGYVTADVIAMLM